VIAGTPRFRLEPNEPSPAPELWRSAGLGPRSLPVRSWSTIGARGPLISLGEAGRSVIEDPGAGMTTMLACLPGVGVVVPTTNFHREAAARTSSRWPMALASLPRVVSVDHGTLLEREFELDRLAAVVEGVRAGSGATVVLEGPAGIGKTRLLEAARELAADADLDVLSARPGELERDLGWGVVRELFEPAVRALSAEERDGVVAGAAGLALPTLGRLGETTLPPGAEGIAVALHGLYWLTANLADRAPLMLAVDDAHWADEPSRRWLAYLSARAEELPVALVVCARPGEPGATADVLASLGAHRSTVVVRPAPLSPAATGVRVREVLGARAESGFCSACFDATGGNPFLLGELLAELARAGVTPADVNAGRVETASPETIARSTLARIGRLGREASALADAVAVLGADARLSQAAALAELDEGAAARVADQLADIDVLRPGLPPEFVHPLVRAAVYRRKPTAQAALLHAQAARLLAESGAPDDSIAQHLLAVEPAGNPEVAGRLRRAAELASAQGAPYVAARYLRRALAEPAPPDQRPMLTYELGHAEAASMGPSGLDTLEQAMNLCEDPIQRGSIALELASAARMMFEFQRAARVLERAAAWLEPGTPLAERIDGELINVAGLDLATSSLAHERVALYHNPTALKNVRDAGVLADLALEVTAAAGPREAGISLARRAIAALVPEQPNPSAVVFAATALMFSDEFDAARALWDRLIAAARGRGSALAYAFGTAFRAELLHRVGEIREAEEDARSSVAIFSEWGAQHVAPKVFLSDALIERGALREAEELLGSTPAPELEGQWHFTRLLYTRGRLRMTLGQLPEALEDLLTCGHRSEAGRHVNPAHLPWRSVAALALAQLGKDREASELANEELEIARRFGAPRTLGIALRGAGLIQRSNTGLQMLAESVDVLSSSGARLEYARAQYEFGAALRRLGRRADAREPLRQALDLAVQTGANMLADRARGELVAAGARPRRDRIEGRDALTASERRVADLAIQGLSNREIAQSLFLSRRTVETHLTHVYRKLDVTDRAGLSAALRDSGASGHRSV
jgi:DNA-binding CsgD family transcriptional regulator